ncbi:MAG: hypothetical protein J0I07_36340 [Myxococcales bacterium]|nr:hypothetical protein [Myxococcales bacterium]
MSMCVPTSAVSTVLPGDVPCNVAGNGLVTGNGSLLPAPVECSTDGLEALYQLFAESNREDSKGAKANVEARSAEKQNRMREREAALERARKAQEDQKGFFDSMGIGSLVGIVAANPALVLADVSMHMARLTPDFLRDFENENKDSIELATKLYCAASNASVLADGIVNPESLRAAIALGGLLVQESEVFGKDASDWAGAGMVVAGSIDGRSAASVIVADKDSAVADQIRDVEDKTREWNKWIAVAGMAIAAAAAIVGSLGTATLPVVAIGVALSAGGFAVTETKCLDALLGEGASMWIGTGMMISGAIISGAGSASAAAQVTDKVAQGTREAARTLQVAGGVVDGLSKTRQGLDTVADAATRHEVDNAHVEAKSLLFQMQRLQRMVEEIIDTVRDLKDGHRRMSQAVNDAVEMQCQTQLMAAGMRA